MSNKNGLQSMPSFLMTQLLLWSFVLVTLPSLQSDCSVLVTWSSLHLDFCHTSDLPPFFPPVARYEGKDGRHSVRRSVRRSRASSQVNCCISSKVLFLSNYFSFILVFPFSSFFFLLGNTSASFSNFCHYPVLWLCLFGSCQPFLSTFQFLIRSYPSLFLQCLFSYVFYWGVIVWTCISMVHVHVLL